MKRVKEMCPGCLNSTKIVDYIWDIENAQYTDKVKMIGYLCESNLFSKKYYRRPNESLGLGCKGYCENRGRRKSIHNNRILKTKKES